MTTRYYANQYITKTLNGAIDASQTTGITLSNTTGVDTSNPGIIAISWTDPLNTTNVEWITYTSINGSGVLQGVTRGEEGSTGKAHSNGAVIAFPISKSHINNINTTMDTLEAAVIYKTIEVYTIDAVANTSTGDGKAYITIPEDLNGWNLYSVHARVITAGTTGTTDIQIRNVTDSVDMLSTKLTIDSGETGSDTAATPAVIDTTKDDVATNDLLRIDLDAISTTPAKGLIVRLRFVKP